MAHIISTIGWLPIIVIGVVAGLVCIGIAARYESKSNKAFRPGQGHDTIPSFVRRFRQSCGRDRDELFQQQPEFCRLREKKFYWGWPGGILFLITAAIFFWRLAVKIGLL